MGRLKYRIQKIITQLAEEESFVILRSSTALWKIRVPLSLEERALGKASLLA
jgi:hypothetical protein